MDVPQIDWRAGKGVAGGWDCVLNGDCSHLEGGEERGWLVFPRSLDIISLMRPRGFKDAQTF